MRVLRAGGRYLEGREQRLWLALAFVVALGGTGVVLVIESPPGGSCARPACGPGPRSSTGGFPASRHSPDTDERP
jgi:hypothetical protein